MRIWGLKTCDTCRKALKAIAATGQAVSLRDIRADPLSAGERAALLAQFGDALINRRSTTWRGLDAEQRARPAGELLRDNPTLMKRPVVETPDGFYLGWDAKVQNSVLGSGGATD